VERLIKSSRCDRLRTSIGFPLVCQNNKRFVVSFGFVGESQEVEFGLACQMRKNRTLELLSQRTFMTERLEWIGWPAGYGSLDLSSSSATLKFILRLVSQILLCLFIMLLSESFCLVGLTSIWDRYTNSNKCDM